LYITFLFLRELRTVCVPSTCVNRAVLKPMQPMQIHWAPRLWGPRAMVVGQVIHFCQILLGQENYRNGFPIPLIEN